MDITILFDPFMLRALAAGVAVAAIAAALGCFVVWRRMAYFGDSLAHGSLLGISLGLVLGLNTGLSSLIFCLIYALLLAWLNQKRIYATDTLLGILAHGALSFGILSISLAGLQRVDLYLYLFGDILTVQMDDVLWMYGGGAVALGLLIWQWPSLVLTTLHEELAKAEGVSTFRAQLVFMVLMAVVVALSTRMVGILLTTSMLIIPAATARHIARSPEAMAVFASLLGILAVVVGLGASVGLDTPSGPTIVSASALIFVFVLVCGSVLRLSTHRMGRK